MSRWKWPFRWYICSYSSTTLDAALSWLNYGYNSALIPHVRSPHDDSGHVFSFVYLSWGETKRDKTHYIQSLKMRAYGSRGEGDYTFLEENNVFSPILCSVYLQHFKTVNAVSDGFVWTFNRVPHSIHLLNVFPMWICKQIRFPHPKYHTKLIQVGNISRCIWFYQKMWLV